MRQGCEHRSSSNHLQRASFFVFEFDRPYQGMLLTLGHSNIRKWPGCAVDMLQMRRTRHMFDRCIARIDPKGKAEMCKDNPRIVELSVVFLGLNYISLHDASADLLETCLKKSALDFTYRVSQYVPSLSVHPSIGLNSTSPYPLFTTIPLTSSTPSGFAPPSSNAHTLTPTVLLPL